MATDSVPTGAPPPYESIDTNSTSQAPPPPHATKTRNGIPPQSRRSMEDEHRAVPSGWIRQYDREFHHQFFVDTNANPPRSIWHHPYDDDQYLASLSTSERSRVQREGLTLSRHPSTADIEAESSEDEMDAGMDGFSDGPGNHKGETGSGIRGGNGAEGAEHIGATHRFGRKMKDKLTHSTHQQREQKRRERAEAERRAYVQHQHFRAVMSRAEETREPQLLGKDRQGKDVYIEPSYGHGGAGGDVLGGSGAWMYGQSGFTGAMGRGAGGGGRGRGMYGDNGYGVNPYTQGVYSNPNARFVRPQTQYSRPYGYGYGGGAYGLGGGMGMGGMGMGLPLMAGLGTGMMIGNIF